MCSLNVLHCGNIPLTTVFQVFQQNFKHNNNYSNYEVKRIEVFVPAEDSYIPANLLVGHRVIGEICLVCQNEGYQKLKINPDAFSFSRDFTQFFSIQSCDLSSLEFSFLKDFKNLQKLAIYSSANVHIADWNSLPPLPSLNWLFEIAASPTLNDWTQFPILVEGLVFAQFSENDICDETMSRMLQWLLDSPSIGTLQDLDLSGNALTYIPQEISLFKQLVFLNLKMNRFIALHTPFKIPKSISYAYLHSNNIEFIKPGSFKGCSYSFHSVNCSN